MPKYKLLMEGHGEGCDIAIGCNIQYRDLKADNLQTAVLEAKRIIDADYGYKLDYGVAAAYIIEIIAELPIKKWRELPDRQPNRKLQAP